MKFKNTLLFIISLLFIIGVASFVYFSNQRTVVYDQTFKSYEQGLYPEVDKAVRLSQQLYLEKKREGTNFANGPCLSNEIIKDWVADTVHNPRIGADDLPKNQCSSYNAGFAHHFVELDINGNLVRTH